MYCCCYICLLVDLCVCNVLLLLHLFACRLMCVQCSALVTFVCKHHITEAIKLFLIYTWLTSALYLTGLQPTWRLNHSPSWEYVLVWYPTLTTTSLLGIHTNVLWVNKPWVSTVNTLYSGSFMIRLYSRWKVEVFQCSIVLLYIEADFIYRFSKDYFRIQPQKSTLNQLVWLYFQVKWPKWSVWFNYLLSSVLENYI